MNYFKKRAERRQAAMAQEGQALQGPGITGEAQGFQGGQGFQENVKSYGATVQGDNPNRRKMRKNYGWRMSDAEYDKLQENEKEFNKAIKGYRSQASTKIGEYRQKSAAEIKRLQGQYGSQKSTYDKSIAHAQRKLFEAKQKLGKMPSQDKIFKDWYQKNSVALRVVDDNGVQGVYSVPKAYAEQIAAKGIEGTWHDKNKAFNVHVRQGGRIRGKEMHELARDLANKDRQKKDFWGNKDVQGSYAQTVKNWSTAANQLKTAESTFETEKQKGASALKQYETNIRLQQIERDKQIKMAQQARDAEINKTRAGRQGEIDANRETFEKQRDRLRQAYGGLSQMQVKSKGDYQSAKRNK